MPTYPILKGNTINLTIRGAYVKTKKPTDKDADKKADKPKGTALKGHSNPIPIERLIELRQKGNSYADVGAIVGCSAQNVAERLANADLEGLELYSKHKAQVFEAKQRKLLDAITDEKMDNMSASQAVVAAAIMEDKIRLIRGQATEIIDIRQISIDLESITKRMQDELSKHDVIEGELV